MLLIFKDLENCLRFLEVPGLLFPRSDTPLWQRGERGDLLNRRSLPFALKIPLHPPFPKGEVFQTSKQSSI
jgi:hypothetical protein